MTQPINRQNTVRSERPKPKTAPVSMKWPTWQADRKSQLAFGGLLILLAIGLTVAFCSYLLTGQADQSVLSKVTDSSLRESGTEMRNFLGVLGAYIAHVFIFRWFGFSALGIPVILFLSGLKLVFNFELLPLGRTTKAVLFYMTWISALAGYIVLATDSIGQGSVWCGGIGYEVNVWLYNLIGWGGIAIIGFALFVFLIFFYGITKLPSIALPQRPVSAPRPSNTNTVNEEEEPEEEEDEDDVDDFIDVKPKSNSVPKPVEPPVSETTEPLNGHEPEVKPEKINGSGTSAASVKKPLTFTIADTTPVEPASEPSQPVAEAYAGPTDEVDEDALKLHGLYDPTLDLPRYQFPTIELLTEYPENKKAQVSAEELEANKDRIVETLQNYGITIDSIKATIGPTVTLYEIIPAAGVRISKIKSLEDDIALSLAALGIRIIAPMPGQGTIGIEVPNKNREMVAMRSVMTTEKFTKSTFELPVVMGKTISNEIYVADLAKMPHLLMAGATGQGKSVGLNVLLTSLIYKKHPSQLKLILVDPKKVELTLFNKLERHFLAQLPDSDEPIITDTKKVVNTLNSLCIEMDNRYNLLKDAQCRNLKEYNAKFIQRRLNPEKGHKFLPYIVLVIDELADLMMTAGKEVEQPIARLAQLARAIGIHLVVATQRPSVNVITGLIKANFPARLSFKVTSKIDSRTILDTGGAEQLVGMGDMLFSSNSDIVRLQCPFVDTNEIEDICDFVGSQRGYDSSYNLPEFAGDDSGSVEEREVDLENRDPMFDEAARLVVNHQQGSTSLIQRRLKLGYNRAGRLIDQLEAAGIVGSFEGSKAREVLIQDINTLEELLKNMN
ncbi:FtsK/SpoIIIE family DNA translocase [Larkinella terrae]|uniref:DNA translocase FtsK n=1 Tax=Larkinella terrae TaxID=2025311 RepID=A0A7K0EE09_9BACT|nr:DNA translocase FtsK [Larkinella terrae]MRS59975.1 DNA translocase FtsK [Larkinella terrae]